MRIAIVGCRDWKDPACVEQQVREYIRSLFIHSGMKHVIVTGYDVEHDLPRGVDKWAYEAAKYFELPYDLFPAEWKKYGKRAGIIRNGEMIPTVDAVTAFWDGQSHGTKNSIDLALKYRKELLVKFP